MPWRVFKEGSRYCVHKLNADDSKGEKVACHDSQEAAEAQMRALYANVNEFRGEFRDVLVITELRGNFPTDIPYFSDVDIAELTKGDDDPMFLTIPIGKANVTSGNKRFYDEAWLQELERQVIAKRPIGIMGHLKEEELGTEFPPEAIFWVGVRRIGEMLWGKGYIPAGAARDRIRRYKAANKAIATSIFALAQGVWNKARGALDMLAETLDLKQIDIGPADRVGIVDLAHVPLLTAEMQSNHIEQEPITMAEKQEVLQELRKTPVQPHGTWTPQEPAEVPALTAIRETLGASEDADLAKLVRELQERVQEQEKAAVKARISELVNDGIQMASARGIVTELVSARKPTTPQEAEAAFNEVIATESVSELLKSKLVATMGPRQTTPVQGQQGKAKYFQIPQEA